MTRASTLQPPKGSHARRGASRRKLDLKLAGSGDDAGTGEVTLLNLTTGGALLRTDLALRLGERIRLRVPGGEETGAKVLWCDAPFFGCRFDKAIGKGGLAAMVLAAAPLAKAEAEPGAPPRAEQATFGARLERLRRQRGWSLSDLAQQVGVSKPALWKWEQGTSRPRPAALERLASILAQTASGLLFGELAEPAQAKASSSAPLQSILDDARHELAGALQLDPATIELSVTIRG